jgi:MoaA/NifB/PqqE/SkfB family radical SAM enzyme
MSTEEACYYVEQAASAGLAGISITGGEPFLDMDRLLAVIHTAYKNGLFARVVTNGYWAGSEKRASSILDNLYDVGLREISISFDAMHEEHIKPESIKCAIETALKKDFKVVISHVKDNGNLDDSLAEYIDKLDQKFEGKLYAMGGYTVPSGKALERKKLDDYDNVQLSHERLSHTCRHVIREPIVVPKGDLYPCCSPSCATDIGFRDSYCIGNVNPRTELVTLLDDLQFNPLFVAMMLHGPKWVHDQIHNADRGCDDLEFINICDLCQSMLPSESARIDFEQKLSPFMGRFAVERFLIDAHHDGDTDKYLLGKSGIKALRPHK